MNNRFRYTQIKGFFVEGVPVPQGSMRTVGRGVVIHSNAKKLKEWRTLVAYQVRAFFQHDEPIDTALRIDLEFYLPRPSTVKRIFPSRKPDLDKLIRAVLDGITESQAVSDDARFVEINAKKFYEYSSTHMTRTPGVFVEFYRIDEERA